ncbi:hypothetical protein QQ045_004032 [Rhodiola kirilowii]
MWAQRSRVSWLSEGDNNTRFFHLKANARKRANSVMELMDHEGRIHTNQLDIERIALNYFGNIFNSVQDLTDDEISLHLNCVPRKVGVRQNELLNEQYTEREVTCALFQLYPSKSPGLDGFLAGFFQKYWNVVKTDFIATCLSFLNEGVLPHSMNDTLIVLIPKQKAARRMEDFRPISLTSVVSKTVAKVIVNRLQMILPEVTQSAFVKGRLITDDYLIAHECAHFIKNVKNGKCAYGSLKLDMSKAYDRVEWKFLRLLLLRLGFENRWVSMVINYISSIRNALRINGSVTEFLIPKRGLCQGNPLSPYLFILCTEWLSHKLHELHAAGHLSGLRINRRALFVTHLLFADDCLLLFKAVSGAASVLSALLKKYEEISGQVVNYNKSRVSFIF